MKWPWDQSEQFAKVESLQQRNGALELSARSERLRAEDAEDACRKATAAANLLLKQRDAAADKLIAHEIAKTVQPSDLVTRCPNPDCTAPERPKKVLCELHDVVMRDGKLEALPGGYRLACQPCGTNFTCDRLGVYRQHPAALPFTPQMPGPLAQGAEKEKREGGPPVRGLPPAREPLMP